MALPLTTHRVYLLDPPAVADAHGNASRTTKDWANAVRTGPLDACVQTDSGSSSGAVPVSEDRDGGREQTRERITVLFDPEVAVEARFGVEVGGVVFDVLGPSFTWPDVGGLGYTVCRADRVEG